MTSRIVCAAVLLQLVVGCRGSGPDVESTTGAEQQPVDEAVLPRLEDAATYERDPSSGAVRLVRDDDLAIDLERMPEYQAMLETRSHAQMAQAFVARYRESFGLADPSSELELLRVDDDDLGYHHVRLSQRFAGLPVLDQELIVHFDAQDHIYMVNGRYVPTPVGLSTDPSLAADEARGRVLEEFEPDAAVTGDRRVIFVKADGQARLCYEFMVSRSPTESWRVIADAESAEILSKVSRVMPTPAIRPPTPRTE